MAKPAVEITGKTLAHRYEVLRLDHEELLGSVYTAHDADEDRLVSVKVLHPDLTEDREKFKRFGREITATYMVAQKNTVEVTDWGEDGDLHYLVMEYLFAHPLEEDLEKGPMQADRVARIGIQIARAVGAAHQEGIVHRALGPANVLLLDNAVEGDFVKVRDFGLSKLEKVEDEETGLTTQNTRVGNAAYMAPEYIKSSKYHTKSDLYALGCLMYHMLTGRPPFSGSMLELLSAHVSEDPPPPSTLVEGIPDWLEDVIMAMLQKSPEDRPGAYRVVQQIETGHGGSLDAPELYELDDEGMPIIPEGPPTLAIALGASLLVLLVLALAVVALIISFVIVVAISMT